MLPLITSLAEASEEMIGFKSLASPIEARKNVRSRPGLPRVWLSYVGTQKSD